MKTNNRNHFLNVLSRFDSFVRFWLLVGFYVAIILVFFRSVLFSWPTVIYAVVIFLILGYIIYRLQGFSQRCALESALLDHLSRNIKSFVKDLKNLISPSNELADPVTCMEEIKANIGKYHHQPTDGAVVARVAYDTLLRYRSKTKLEISEIMEESFDPSTKSVRGFLNGGASVSIAIGLLGTFAGMLHSLDGNITISNLLSGLNEAIGSSLVGVLTAIFILAFSKLYETHEAELRERFSKFVMWGLFPEFQVETIVTIDDRAAEIIGRKIGEALSQQLRGVFQDLANAVKALDNGIAILTRSLTEHNDKLGTLITDLREAIIKWNDMIININRHFETMREALKGLAIELKQNKVIMESANKQLIEVLGRLDNTSTMFQNDLRLWINENPAVAIADHVRTFKSGADKLYKIISSLNETFNGHMETFIQHASAYWQPLEGSMQQHVGAMNQFTQKVTALEQQNTQISKQLAGLAARLKTLTDQLDESESMRKKIARIQLKADKKIYDEYAERLKKGELLVQNGRIVISQPNWEK